MSKIDDLRQKVDEQRKQLREAEEALYQAERAAGLIDPIRAYRHDQEGNRRLALELLTRGRKEQK